ncbi:MAG: methyltransferase domain-containing protein [Anaerolineae bacterium]|nr:methyltransferase domain-containing protein [Anaerolineae bacterium]
MTAHWNAADYHQQSSAQAIWAHELIAKLALRGHEHLLDIGCGTGRITALFAEQLPEGIVVGIDSSADMITFAQDEYTQPNLRFVHMPAQALDLDDTFDVVFSNAVLHWVHDHEAVLRGMRRHIQPGGSVLLQMGGQGNAQAVVEIFNAVIARPAWRAYFADFAFPYAFYGPDQYTDWLPATGFTAQRIELIPKTMTHTLDGLKGWLRTTWFPYTDCVPADQRDTLIDQVATAYLAAHPVNDQGQAEVAMVRLEVEARADGH